MTNVTKMQKKLCEFCKTASAGELSPVFVFADEKNRGHLADKLANLGFDSPPALTLLGAYAVKLSPKDIEELSDCDFVSYIHIQKGG